MAADPDVERRRRTVEQLLDDRPELDLADLHAALAGEGLDVDHPTLLADLDALGFDLVDVPDPDPGPDPDPDPDPEPPDPELAIRSDAAPTDLITSSPGTPRRERKVRVGRRGRAGVVVPLLALGPLVAAVVLALTGGAGTATARGQTRAAAEEAETGEEEAERPSGPAPTAPQGPGADPALAAGADATLALDETAELLPPVLSGIPWRQDIGTWKVLDARAVGSADGADDGALATFDARERDLRLEIELPDAYDTTGIAFSVEEDDYMLWAPAAGFPTIALYRVEDGEITFVLHSERSELGPGMRLGVHIVGDQVELLAGGAVVATYEDPGTSARVGLAVAPGGAFGTFDDVVVDLALPA